MTRILGLDPGSRLTGYGVVEVDGGRHRHVASGCVRLANPTLAQRLAAIFTALGQVIAEHRPEEMAVERVFVHHNVDSALKLGQARGVAICAGAVHGLALFEYAPREIKKSIVGTGSAEKAQVQHMVKMMLALPGKIQEDAADALAVALCHGHVRQTLARNPGLPADYRRGRR